MITSQFSHWFFWLFATAFFVHLLFEFVLDWLNLRFVQKHRNKIPEEFRNTFSENDYQKSIDYTVAKTRFHWIQLAFQTVLIWFLILSGAFGLIDHKLTQLLPNDPFIRASLYPFVIGALFYVFGLPFAIAYQFGLEERFGFNKTKPITFVADQFRTGVLALMLGWPIFALVLWFINATGQSWWFLAFAAIMLFQLFTAAIFPVVIAPIFYKFTPLADGELKDRLKTLAKRIGFSMSGIFTIDGSRRSAHSNAFFAGIGKTRRVVLFDTLMKSMNVDEIEAVIAHEMGHNIKKHIQKQLLLSSLVTFLGFYIASLALQWEPFFQAFAVAQPSAHVGLVLFALFSGVFVFPIGPLFKYLSRKYEFEADQFAVHTTASGKSMVNALLKLSKENLSNLTPHPWYSFYHYSHPTASERIAAMNSVK